MVISVNTPVHNPIQTIESFNKRFGLTQSEGEMVKRRGNRNQPDDVGRDPGIHWRGKSAETDGGSGLPAGKGRRSDPGDGEVAPFNPNRPIESPYGRRTGWGLSF